MGQQIRVLVIDDEEPLRRLLKKELERKSFTVETAADGRAGLDLLGERTFDIVLLDIVMPGMGGMAVLSSLKGDPSAPAVIVLTGKATIETAVEAMRNGAYDYLTKPYKLDELVIVINRAYEYRAMSTKTRIFQQELLRKGSPVECVGASKQMKEILSLVRKIAPTDSAVLIQGESGTGKEVVANTIWHHSKRGDFPFIALNCATLSENLIESEIFGHEKGAFTSAFQTKHGIVEVADKGTLFLDEIGEMPSALQAKLLRFLDSGEFRRVGSNKPLKVDVRLITATNRNLPELVSSGAFREDLYYRLNVITVTIPPLRERPEDIEALADFFLKRFSKKFSKDIRGFRPAAMQNLLAWHWPGNVRELENVTERAVILCESDLIGPGDLSLPVQAASNEKNAGATRSLDDMERDHILSVLKEANGNQSRASQLLGIDRKTLYHKLKKYGISQ